jgi:O-antigen/teichoic acid export membrane protein
MSLIKKLAGETAIYGTSSILSRLLNYLILTPYLTRTFAEAEYGVVSILYTYAAILMIAFTYRMETAFFRFGSKEGQMDRAFSTASFSLFFSTIVFCLLIWTSIEPISAWLNFGDHPEYILTVMGIIAMDALVAIPFARLRLENRPIWFATAKTLHILLNIGFIFLFLKILPDLYANGHEWTTYFFRPDNRIGDLFLANLLASGILVLILAPVYLRIKLVFVAGLWKQMINYAWPLIIVGFAAVINQLIALPLLENLLPGSLEENRAQTGIYSAAAKLAVLMNLFTQAFNYAAEPFFFRHAERDDSQQVYGQVGYAFAIVGSLVFLGISLYLDLIKFFLGPDLRGGLGVVPILLLAYLFLGALLQLFDLVQTGRPHPDRGLDQPRWGSDHAAGQLHFRTNSLHRILRSSLRSIGLLRFDGSIELPHGTKELSDQIPSTTNAPGYYFCRHHLPGGRHDDQWIGNCRLRCENDYQHAGAGAVCGLSLEI